MSDGQVELMNWMAVAAAIIQSGPMKRQTAWYSVAPYTHRSLSALGANAYVVNTQDNRRQPPALRA